jgi:fibronectin-binding autotransporter adhesin
VLTAATLAGSAGGDVGLTSVNAIGGLGSFNVTGGSFSLNDSGLTGNLTMSGPVTAASVTITGATTLTATGFIQATDSAGAVSLTSGSGGISLGSGAIVTGATFVVDAGGGAITESGAINAGTLTGSAGTTASFTGNNTIATLGSFTAPDGFALNNGEVLAIAGPVSSNSGTVVVSNGTFGLSLPGTISALAATLAAGSIGIGGTLAVTGSASLVSGGAITEGGTIQAATLSGSAGTTASFTGSNTIATLGAFSAPNGFTLLDKKLLSIAGLVTTNSGTVVIDTGTFGLTLPGRISAAAATLSAGSIAIDGTLAVTDTASFIASGSITESGAISAGTLAGSAGTTATLTGANTIATLSSFSAPDGFTLNNGEVLSIAGPVSSSGTVVVSNGSFGLTVPGTISALAATLSASSIGIAGALAVTDTASLVSGGGITESGVINAGTLTGSAGATASFTGNNTIGTLVNFGVTGGTNAFDLTDATPLIVAGTVTGAGNVYLRDTGVGGITIASSGSVGAGTTQFAGFQTDLFTINAGGKVTGGTFELAPNTPGRSLTLGTGGAGLALSSLSGIGPAALRLGAVTLPGDLSPTITARSIVVAGAFGGGAISVELDSLGGISQTSGVLTAGILTGHAAGGVSLGSANAVGNLDSFNVSGGSSFTLVDSGLAGGLGVSGVVTAANVTIEGAPTVTVTGTIAAAGTLILSSGAGGIQLDAGDFLSAGLVDLSTTGGGVHQAAGGTIAAGVLTSTGDIAGAAILQGTSNQIGTISGLTAVGTLTVVDSEALVLAGIVSAGSTGTVDIGTTGGGLTQGAAGTLIAGTLTGTGGIAGEAILQGTANQIGSIVGLTANGTLTVVDDKALVLAGLVSAGSIGTIDISTTNGGLTQGLSGTLVAGSLVSTGGIAGAAILQGSANQIGAIGGLTAAGALAVVDNQALTLAGLVSAGSTGTVDIHTMNGGLTQGPSGTLVAGVLTSTNGIGGAAILQGTANQIGTIGGLTAIGELTVVNQQALALAGLISVGPAGVADIHTINGGLTEGPAGTLIAGVLTSTNGIGGAAILQGTSNQIGTISRLTAVGGLTVVDNQALTLAGLVSAGTTGTIDVHTVDGGLMQGAAGTLITGTLTSTGGIGGAAILQGAANQIGTITELTVAGSLTAVDNEALILAGLVSAGATGTVDIHTAIGGVTQGPSGTLIADTLTSTGGIGGAAILQGTANLVGTISGVTAIGALTVVDNEALALAEVVSAGTAGTVDIHTTNGGVTEGPDGALMTGVLTSTGGIEGAAVLQGTANQIGTIAGLTAVGALTVVDNEALALAGLVSAGSAGVVDIHTTGGGLTQGASGTLVTGTLTSTGGIAGGATLLGTGNQIATISDLTAVGNLTVVDTQALGLAGLVSAGSTGLADISTTAGGVTQSSTGTLIAGTLLSSGGITGSVSLQGTNLIANLGSAAATPGALRATEDIVVDDATDLTIAGDVVAGSGTPASSTASLTIASTGAMTVNGQAAAASVAGNVTLIAGNLFIASAGGVQPAIEAAGAVTMVSAGVLSQTGGAVGAGSVALFALNGATLSNGAIVATTGSVGITAPLTTVGSNETIAAVNTATGVVFSGSVNQSAASYIGSNGSVSVGSMLTESGGALLAVGDVALGSLSQSGGTIAAGGALTIGSGSFMAGWIGSSATIGSFNQSGGLLAAAGAGNIFTTGVFAQTAGVLATGGTLGVTANLGITIGGTVSAAGPSSGFMLLASGGDAVLGISGLLAGAALDVPGDMIPGNALQAPSGTVQVAGPSGTQAFARAAPVGKIAAVTGYQVTPPAGLPVVPVFATPLVGVPDTSTPTPAQFRGAAIDIERPVTASTLGLYAAASIVEGPSAVINAARLTGSSGSDVNFLAPGNTVGTLGTFDDTGHGFHLVDASNLMLTGLLSANSVQITDMNFTIDLAGAIAANSVLVQAADIALTTGSSFSGLGAGSATPLKADPFPLPGSPGIYLNAANISVAANPPLATGYTVNWTFALTGSGNVALGNFQQPRVKLFLNLASGTATGQVDVAGLQVLYDAAAPAMTTIDLTGVVGGISGQATAGDSHIASKPNNKYQINGCPISSLNCIRFTGLTVPVTNPLQDVDVGNVDQLYDTDSVLPDVAERDY